MTAGEGASARAAASACRVKVDGNDVEAVDAAAARLVAEIRAGGGPRLLHAMTYRFKGHVSVDPATTATRPRSRRAEDDPLALARRRCWRLGLRQRHRRIDAAAHAEIECARGGRSGALARPARPTQTSRNGAGQWTWRRAHETLSYAQAAAAALRQPCDADPRVVALGEDLGPRRRVRAVPRPAAASSVPTA